MYESFMKLEGKILDTYYALSEAEVNGNKAKYKRMYKRLRSLLKTENVYKNHGIFSTYLVAFSDMYDEELEGISCESEQEFISYMTKTRINNIIDASVLMSNSEFVMDSFETDLTKRALLLLKADIDSETDPIRKKELTEHYYMMICATPRLEQEFVTNRKLIEMQSVKLLESRDYFKEECGCLEGNKIEILKNSILGMIDSIIMSGEGTSLLSDFRLHTLEYMVKARLSYLPMEEFKYVKIAVLCHLDEIKDLIPLSAYYRVKELFKVGSKTGGHVYSFRNMQ